MVNTGRLALSSSGKACGPWSKGLMGLTVGSSAEAAGFVSWSSHFPPTQHSKSRKSMQKTPLSVLTSNKTEVPISSISNVRFKTLKMQLPKH